VEMKTRTGLASLPAGAARAMQNSAGENRWLHRYAVLLAACTALLFITGTVVTGNEERPLYSLGRSHIWLGAAVTLMMAGLAIWLWRLNERPWLRHLALTALAASIVQALVGLETGPPPATVRIAHALLGQFFLSTVVAIAVFTSGSREKSPETVVNGPRLRFLAMATPAIVLFQVVLGTAFRHGVMGVGLHLFWALFVGVFLVPVMAAVFGTTQPEVRAAGIALSVLASVQILLGFALLTMQAVDADPVALIVAAMVHAAVGAFTLATAVAMAILVRRATLEPVASPAR
jgi:heme A synthase